MSYIRYPSRTDNSLTDSSMASVSPLPKQVHQAAFSYDAELQAAGLSVMGPARSSGGLDMAGRHSALVTCSEVLSWWWESSEQKPKGQDCATQGRHQALSLCQKKNLARKAFAWKPVLS